MTEFIEVFDVDGSAVGLYVDGRDTFLAVPIGLNVDATVGLYVPSRLVTIRELKLSIDGEAKLYRLILWTADFDDAVRRIIERLSALRWSLPQMKQLPFVAEPDTETAP